MESWGLSPSNLENPHQAIEVIVEGNFRVFLSILGCSVQVTQHWFDSTPFQQLKPILHNFAQHFIFNSSTHNIIFKFPSCAFKIQYSTKLLAQGVDYFNGSGWSCKTAEGDTACIGGIGGTMIGSNMTLGAYRHGKRRLRQHVIQYRMY